MAKPTANAWSSSLFDCFDDCGLCCMTCWCPCVTFGRVAEMVDKGSPSCCASAAIYALLCAVTGCQCIYSCVYRGKMRAQNGLADAACADCCVHMWCERCALCQEYRELVAGGYDPKLGWDRNVQRGAAAAPAAQHMGR